MNDELNSWEWCAVRLHELNQVLGEKGYQLVSSNSEGLTVLEQMNQEEEESLPWALKMIEEYVFSGKICFQPGRDSFFLYRTSLTLMRFAILFGDILPHRNRENAFQLLREKFLQGRIIGLCSPVLTVLPLESQQHK